MTSKTILIGCDPELFVYNGKLSVSAHDLIPGTKYDPHPVPRGAVQVDGVAAEFNIDPAKTEDEFVVNILSVRSELEKMIKEKNPNYQLLAKPTIRFNRIQWKNIPEEAKALGCEPDFSAYKPGVPNEKPETTKFMRTGSGHVHISWGDTVANFMDRSYLQHCASLVWHLDKHLYKNSLLWDKDTERQELYGKPGAFRPKKYGLEYRTLSNAWLDSEKTIRYVYNVAKTCTENWLQGLSPNAYSVRPFAG